MTAAGYRVTRWADNFVVVCRTRQGAQSARALAGSFLRNELGVSLHPEKTRIVPPGAASGTRYPLGQMHRLNV